MELYKKWRSLEGGSRRQARAKKINFVEKQEQLHLDPNLPQDIMALETENIIQHSGIMDLREEVEYLRSQMTRESKSEEKSLHFSSLIFLESYFTFLLPFSSFFPFLLTYFSIFFCLHSPLIIFFRCVCSTDLRQPICYLIIWLLRYSTSTPQSIIKER